MTAKIDPEVSRDADIARIAELLHKAGLIADNGLWLDRSLATPFARALYDAGLRPSAEPLDTAWREAEAALPETWFMGGLTNTSYRGDRERWLAQAYQGPEPDADYRVFKHGYGDTPVDALRALAAALLPTQASDS